MECYALKECATASWVPYRSSITRWKQLEEYLSLSQTPFSPTEERDLQDYTTEEKMALGLKNEQYPLPHPHI